MSSTQAEMEKTITGKILHSVWFDLYHEKHGLNDFDKESSPWTRKAFVEYAKCRFGEEGKKEAKRLWNEGYINFNANGYVNLTDRGFQLWHGKDTPKRHARKHQTFSEILDQLYANKNSDLVLWLKSKGFIKGDA